MVFKVLNEEQIEIVDNIRTKYRKAKYKGGKGLKASFIRQGNFTICTVKNGVIMGVGVTKLNMDDVKKKGPSAPNNKTGRCFSFSRAMKCLYGIE